MSTDQTIEDIRVSNARALVEEAGSQARFALRLGIGRQQANHFVGPKRVKQIGSVMARRIESAFGRPHGWMDVAHDGRPAARAELVTIDRIAATSAFATVPGVTDAVVHQMLVSREWLRRTVGASPAARLSMATVLTDEMEPELRQGSLVLVDRSVTSVTGAGIYTLRRRDDPPGQERFRRLHTDIDGTTLLRAANPAYASAQVSSLRKLGLAVLGRVVAVLDVRPV